jgi:PAS domain S-box-containing protein
MYPGKRKRHPGFAKSRHTAVALETIVDNSSAMIYACDREGRFLLINRYLEEALGVPREQLIGKTREAILPAAIAAVHRAHDLQVLATQRPITVEEVNEERSGRRVYLSTKFPLIDNQGKPLGVGGVSTDITDRKQAEETLRKWSHVIEQSPASIVITNCNGIIEYVNPKGVQTTGYTREELIGAHPRIFKSGRTSTLGYQNLWATISSGAVWQGEFHNKRKNGELYWEYATIAPIRNERGIIEHYVAIKEDITERKQKTQELETVALISSALRKAQSRGEMLTIMLNEVRTLLHADGAACVLCGTETGSPIVEMAVGNLAIYTGRRLPPDDSLCASVLRLGHAFVCNEDFPGSGAPDAPPDAVRASACVPLISHEQTIGALWIDRTGPLNGHDLDVLTAIADIAANAIHRITLHEQTEQDARALALAYESTITGWSRALDLRDKETEGHSERVTTLTVRLAQAAGVSPEALVHIRRGALLHDIGKMGIPDSILLKPGPLTDDEWAIMRKHPQYAYDMLYPITYLHPALDIPYCHHEKWDGTGYPRGLRGTAIPLAARLFAVVDVWDALRSNRPYRQGWPEERVLAYIREQAGRHFDPWAVGLFLEVLNGVACCNDRI